MRLSLVQMPTSIVALLLLSFSSCRESSMGGRGRAPWPDLSFVVMDQIPSAHVFERTENIVPTARRVVLLPIVSDYTWRGTQHDFAIADPILAVPGEMTFTGLIEEAGLRSDQVTRFLVLARVLAATGGGWASPNR